MQNEPREDAMDLALWRYGITSALLHRDANGIGLYPLLDQLAQQHYVRPDGRIVQLSCETLRKWLNAADCRPWPISSAQTAASITLARRWSKHCSN